MSKSLLPALAAFCCLLISLPVSAQTFSDAVEFENACPDLTTEDFESFELENFPGLPGVATLGFADGLSTSIGDLSPGEGANDALAILIRVTDEATLGFEVLVDSNFAAYEDDVPLTFTLDEAATHFGFTYLADDGVTLEFYDTDGVLISSETLPVTDDIAGGNQNDIYADDPPAFFGYEAPAGTEIGSVVITGGNVAFDDVSVGNCATEETCFSQLEDLKASVEALFDSAQGCELHRLQAAYDCLCIMQDPLFWHTENRLSAYGSSFFIGGAYTIAYLEYSGNPDVAPIVASVLDLLECIVDNEIAYAIDNDGNTCHLYFAEAYADVATQLEEDFDLNIVAALAYRLAWLHAYYSTD